MREAFERMIELGVEAREAELLRLRLSAPSVYVEVEDLLRYHDGAGGMIDELPGKLERAKQASEPAPREAEVRAGDVILGCTVLRRIGGGRAWLVFEAQEAGAAARVCLKVARAAMLDAEQLRDARAVAERVNAAAAFVGRGHSAIDGTSVQRVRRVEEAGIKGSRRVCAVLDLARGVPITELARSHGLSLRERLVLARKACAGLAALHGAGTVHGDVRPGKILCELGPGGVVPSERAEWTSVRLIGGWLGEWADAPVPDRAGARVDLLGLGRILHELVFGEPPVAEASAGHAAPELVCKASSRSEQDVRVLVEKLLGVGRLPRIDAADQALGELSRAIERA